MSYSALPPLQTLSLDELRAIAVNFIPPTANSIKPKAAFFGYCRYLSMSDKEHISTQLGFEYAEAITTTEDQSDYARLVVIGDAYDDSIFDGLYHSYKSKDGRPTIIENSVPVIMESELVKIHPNYPNINKSTSWKNLSISGTME
jgi:hypothetical protein